MTTDNDLIRRGEVLGAYEQAVDDYNDGKTGKWFRAHFADAIAAIPAAHAPTVKVKPLVWAQEGKQPEHAVSIVGTYLLVKDFDGWRWMRVVGRSLADVCLDPFPSPEAAKSAAQADYDARILALIPQEPKP